MIKKTAVPRVDLVGNKIAEKITKAATKDNHDEDLKKIFDRTNTRINK